MTLRIPALLLAAAAFVTPATAANICIDTRDIISTKSDDGKIMLFKMRDGRTLVNHLQGVCPTLRFYGFVWVLPSGDRQVCEHQQSLRVLQSSQICVLGKFDTPVMSRGTN